MCTRAFIFLFVLFTGSVFAHADETLSYDARCNGQGFDSKPLTVIWDGSFNRDKLMDHLDAGTTNFKITRNVDGKVPLDTTGGTQKFFRQTEPGVSFSGVYTGAFMTTTNQTVYLNMLYGQVSSVYWFMSAIKAGRDLQKSLDGTTFRLQAFAEEDPNSTVSLQFQCSFTIN